MTSCVVSDSSIVIATVLDEINSEKAHALVETWQRQNLRVTAPLLFRYEVVAVVRKHVYRGLLTPEEGITACDRLLSYPIDFMMDKARCSNALTNWQHNSIFLPLMTHNILRLPNVKAVNSGQWTNGCLMC